MAPFDTAMAFSDDQGTLSDQLAHSGRADNQRSGWYAPLSDPTFKIILQCILNICSPLTNLAVPDQLPHPPKKKLCWWSIGMWYEVWMWTDFIPCILGWVFHQLRMINSVSWWNLCKWWWARARCCYSSVQLHSRPFCDPQIGVPTPFLARNISETFELRA